MYTRGMCSKRLVHMNSHLDRNVVRSVPASVTAESSNLIVGQSDESTCLGLTVCFIAGIATMLPHRSHALSSAVQDWPGCFWNAVENQIGVRHHAQGKKR